MKCIFCKQDSSNSKSVEHILPESLGNKTSVLRAGIVCDSCNNYIAREVEKPFLEHDAIKKLRFEEGILNKKGRAPYINGVILSEQDAYPISFSQCPPFSKHIGADMVLQIDKNSSLLPDLTKGKIITPVFDISVSFPTGRTLSRFLGKIALEVLAHKADTQNEYEIELLALIVDDCQFDDIRDHVRRGTITEWPCHVREIYNKNIPMFDPDTGELYQIINEFDILRTEYNEFYLVVALFGIECVMNIGGAEIAGYVEWLKKHDKQSPLYYDWRRELTI